MNDLTSTCGVNSKGELCFMVVPHIAISGIYSVNKLVFFYRYR